MNKRTFVKTIFLGVPAVKPSIESNQAPLNLAHILGLMEGIRIEMSNAQHRSFNELKAIVGCDTKDAGFTAGMLHAIPVSLSEKVPSDEVWLVGHDGTVISKVINLALPGSH